METSTSNGYWPSRKFICEEYNNCIVKDMQKSGTMNMQISWQEKQESDELFQTAAGQLHRLTLVGQLHMRTVPQVSVFLFSIKYLRHPITGVTAHSIVWRDPAKCMYSLVL